MASKDFAREPKHVHELHRSCILEGMNMRRRFSSLLPVSSLLLIGLATLAGGSASCGSDKACIYFTQADYDIDNACTSRDDVLEFFQGDFCSTPIVSVDSDGIFDGDTCCYEVTESDEFWGCGVVPTPPPDAGTGGVGGTGGFGGTGGGTSGMGGAGGSETCARCAQFLLETNPPPLCAASIPIYEAYSDCKCYGPCKTVCADNCSMQTPSTECETCMLDTTSGCGNEYLACASDQ